MTGLGVLAVAEQGPAAGVDSLPQSVWPTLVASGSPVSALAASRVCPVLQAASISSASAPMEVYSSGACSPDLPRLGQGPVNGRSDHDSGAAAHRPGVGA
jgi:hypothetical protein